MNENIRAMGQISQSIETSEHSLRICLSEYRILEQVTRNFLSSDIHKAHSLINTVLVVLLPNVLLTQANEDHLWKQ